MAEKGAELGRTAVIADDHPIMRDAVRRVLADIRGIEIVEEVEDGIRAIRAARVHQPTLFVRDLPMPYAQGVEVFVEIPRQSPRALSSQSELDWRRENASKQYLRAREPMQSGRKAL
ncbi:MAG: response regulator [Pseudomonadota bacterium]